MCDGSIVGDRLKTAMANGVQNGKVFGGGVKKPAATAAAAPTSANVLGQAMAQVQARYPGRAANV